MLKDSKVSAIAPAADLARARVYYADALGLTPAEETPGGLTYHVGGGTELFLYQTEYAGQAGHTVAAFRVATSSRRWRSCSPGACSSRPTTCPR